jgi:hypothetical protein
MKRSLGLRCLLLLSAACGAPPKPSVEASLPADLPPVATSPATLATTRPPPVPGTNAPVAQGPAAATTSAAATTPSSAEPDCIKHADACQRAIERLMAELRRVGIRTTYQSKPSDHFVRGPGAHTANDVVLRDPRRKCDAGRCRWQFSIGDAAVHGVVDLEAAADAQVRIDPHDWDGEPQLTPVQWLRHRRAKEAMGRRVAMLAAVRRHCTAVEEAGHRCAHWIEQVPKPGCKPADDGCSWRAYVGGLSDVAASRHFTVVVSVNGRVAIDDGLGNRVPHATWLRQSP